MSLHKGVGTVVAALSVLVIAVATLTPDPTAGYQPVALCIACGSLGGVDFFLNILLFIPLGVGLRLRGIAPWRAWLFALAVTITVEALQIRVVAGRDASIGDVISNATGALVGILLAEHWRSLVFPSPRRSRRLAVCAALAWLAAIAFGAWAVTPSIGSGPYEVLWAPDLHEIELFGGEVLDASLNGAPLARNQPIVPAGSLAERVARDTVTLGARIVAPRPSYDIAPILSIASRDDSMLVVLGQDANDLVFRVRLKAGQLRLRMPMAASADAIAPVGDTLQLTGTIARGRVLRVELRGRSTETTAMVSLDPFLLWNMVSPIRHFRPSTIAVLSIVWVVLLVAPLSWWSGRAVGVVTNRARGRALAAAGLAVAIVLGLAAVPPLFGFDVARPAHWIAAVVSAAAWAALGERSSPQRRGGHHVEREIAESEWERDDATHQRAHREAPQGAEQRGNRTW
jgi:VanZ family protein